MRRPVRAYGGADRKTYGANYVRGGAAQKDIARGGGLMSIAGAVMLWVISPRPGETESVLCCCFKTEPPCMLAGDKENWLGSTDEIIIFYFLFLGREESVEREAERTRRGRLRDDF